MKGDFACGSVGSNSRLGKYFDSIVRFYITYELLVRDTKRKLIIYMDNMEMS